MQHASRQGHRTRRGTDDLVLNAELRNVGCQLVHRALLRVEQAHHLRSRYHNIVHQGPFGAGLLRLMDSIRLGFY